MKKLSVQTTHHTEFINLTRQVQKSLDGTDMESGICTVFVPHTTAGITINENADPDVLKDLTYLLDKMVPWKDTKYLHFEGNTAAHLKASMMGSSVSIPVENGKLQLGRWQGIFFAEFDGPRIREAWIKTLENVKKDNDI